MVECRTGYYLPRLIDMHVHLREPGRTQGNGRDRHGAAVAGGFTASHAAEHVARDDNAGVTG